MEAASILESFLHSFVTILGAVAGIAIGVSKEGAQLIASLASASGRQALYAGSPRRLKKVDNGPYRYETPKPATGPGQEDVKQFLGTRPPELKQAPPVIRTYTSKPVLGDPRPTPPPPASPRIQQNTAPSTVSAGTTQYPVPGSPLPDIFGTETSFITNRPISPPPVRTAQPASPIGTAAQPVKAAPLSPPALDGSTVDHESPDMLTDDETASVASETSPEGKQSTDSKIRKLRKRISSKLKIGKA